ncbi:phage tail tape measure protein [Streptomyces uncialis]|uniref:phage tail tape measure protein n=1 Tax=Streptomyces uncialis TaxID=1048205 RepID=UPI0037FD2368
MAGAYNLYVSMTANTAGLRNGLRSSAGDLRRFDGQLSGVGGRLNEVQVAAQRLARAQAVASADMVRAQTAVTRASQRAAAAQQVVARTGRAVALAASLATKAEEARTAALVAGERAARARALADTMAARAAAATGAGAAAAARTAAAAQTSAAGAAAAHAAAQSRATAATDAASRASTLAATRQNGLADAEHRARDAVSRREEAQRQAARTADATTRQVSRAEGELTAAREQQAASAAQSALVIGAALGVGVANAIALEREMANVMTISQQITGDNVAAFTDEIVRLSTALPQTAEQLAQGLYQVVSTGFDGAEAMSILEVAAKGASAGLTTSETSARALLGVLKAYGMEAGDAGDVMDTMFQTVNLGVISFEELAQQLGDVVPMAAAAGVEFDDVSAALAAITLAGIPAAEGVTALNMLMTRLMKPTRELRDEMRKMGYESTAAAVKQDGLYVVVNKLNRATGGSAESLSNMWKDIRATRAALALAAADGQNYADTYKGIAMEVARAGATQKAYAIQVDTTAGQWALFRNQATALGIDMGRALLPVLKGAGEAMNVLAGAVNDLPGPVKAFAGGLMAVVVAGLLARAVISRVGTQLTTFRGQLAAARMGGGAFPAVMSGAGLAVSGLSLLLTAGVLAYAAYSASKQEAKAATEELVTALRAEREEGTQGAGLRKLTEQLTGNDGDVKKLKDAGVSVEKALDAITSGGRAYKDLIAEMDAGKAASWEVSGRTYTYDISFDRAKGVLEKQRKIWGDAVKKESSLAAALEIVESKIRKSRTDMAGLWDLTATLPLDKNGNVKFTDEMQAMGKALGDIVDPAKAWKAAQDEVAEANRKAGKSADTAKASLADYMRQLGKQLESQRNWQRNLGELAAADRLDLADHFTTLGVEGAPILDELVEQLKAGKEDVANELENVITEGAARSTPAFRAGLEQLPAIAEQYGKEVASAWSDAAATNDPAKLGKVMRRMALEDLGRATKDLPDGARRSLEGGMELLTEVATRGGQEAAQGLSKALMDGDYDSVRTQLANIFGADIPISEPDLSAIVAGVQQAGSQANAEWNGALELIRVAAAEKGPAAAAALTSALLSGDMAAVKANLDAIGLSVTQIPGSKEVTVTVTANQPPPVIVPVVIQRRPSSWDVDGNGMPDGIQAKPPRAQADGSVLDFYAEGGLRGRRENHVAQIAPAGAWRVWAEESTGGEAYIPLGHTKRARSRAIADETVRRLGGRRIEWYADGGLSDWTYSPSEAEDVAELSSVSSIRSDSMRKVKRKVRKWQKGTKRRKGKWVTEVEETEVFDVALFEKNLDKASRKAAAWRKDLATVARRAGTDVADALEAMGEDGVELTRRMATGSRKNLDNMVGDLKRLGLVAKSTLVTLGDFTSQLKGATKDQKGFETNLARLAAWGYGDLARQLAEQGDEEAQTLAAQAVKSRSKAKTGNAAAKAAAATVADDDLPDLIRIIGAIKSSRTGIHAVADALEMDEDEVIRIANAGRTRIKSVLGSKSTKFMADLGRANRELSYAQGGILTPGIYATSNGVVRFAEPSTGGEAFIPLGASTRGNATNVLRDVANRFGYRLAADGGTVARPVDARPAGGVQIVVVREQPAALVGSMPVTVNGGGDRSAADKVGAAVMRRLRNAQRGGRI